jgi:hypothetical protein
VPAGEPAALAPEVAEQLVHLAAHALEVDQQVSVSCHGLSLATAALDLELLARAFGALTSLFRS